MIDLIIRPNSTVWKGMFTWWNVIQILVLNSMPKSLFNLIGICTMVHNAWIFLLVDIKSAMWKKISGMSRIGTVPMWIGCRKLCRVDRMWISPTHSVRLIHVHKLWRNAPHVKSKYMAEIWRYRLGFLPQIQDEFFPWNNLSCEHISNKVSVGQH